MAILKNAPAAQASMMIRRPVAQVFEAFVDPAITSQFWFTKGAGRLEAGKQVRWDWEMYGVHADVDVKDIVENERIVIEWPQGDYLTRVEWVFTARGEGETFVDITNTGFQGEGDDMVRQVVESTGGFNIVLCGAKAFLEHGLRLNLVEDKFPDAHVEGWQRGG